MNRKGFRTFSLVVLVVSGIATVGTIVTEGCAYTGNGDPAASVCAELGSYVQTCDVASTCAASFTSNCSKFSNSVSEATINAIFDCSNGTVKCGDSTSALTSPCFLESFPFEFSSLASTAAQVQLAHDYCHACAPDQSNCGQLLFLPASDASVPPGGGAIYAAGDSILEAIDSQCIAGLPADAGAACADTFTKCAAPIVAAGIYLPPDCIVSGYTAAGQSATGAGPTDAGPTDAETSNSDDAG